MIFGSRDSRVPAKLLEHDATPTLNKAIDIAITAEATTSQFADIRSKEPWTTIISTLKTIINNTLAKTVVIVAGYIIKLNGLSAYNSKCRKCHKLHQWERVCRSKPGRSCGETL